MPLPRPDLSPDHIRNCTLDRPFNHRRPSHHTGCGKLARRCERHALHAAKRERRIQQIAKATRGGRHPAEWIPRRPIASLRR